MIQPLPPNLVMPHFISTYTVCPLLHALYFPSLQITLMLSSAVRPPLLTPQPSCPFITPSLKVKNTHAPSVQDISPAIPQSHLCSANAYGDTRFLPVAHSSPLPPTLLPSKQAPNIKNSSLCPPVPADTCLMAWSTPFSLSYSADIDASFPPEITARARAITLKGLFSSSLTCYSAGLL